MRVKQYFLFFLAAVSMHAVSFGMDQFSIEGRTPSSGGILAVTFRSDVEYVVLTQEAAEKHAIDVNGQKVYPYSDFSGKLEVADPTIFDTIVREFTEEAIAEWSLKDTLDSREKVMAFLRENNSIKEIFVYGFPSLPKSCDATFVVNFDKYFKAFTEKFYAAREAEQNGQNRADYLAKKSIAVVEYSKLKNALKASKYGDLVFVDAIVIGDAGKEVEEKILIRPYFISKFKASTMDETDPSIISKNLAKNAFPFLSDNSAPITYRTWAPRK